MPQEFRVGDWQTYRMEYRDPHRQIEPVDREIAVVDEALEALHRAGILPHTAYDGEKFLAECYVHNPGGYSLVPIDNSKPIGPDNFAWVHPKDLGLEIDGKWYPSREAQKLLGVSQETIRQRRNV